MSMGHGTIISLLDKLLDPMEHGIDENNYEELLKTGITNSLDGSEDNMLRVADNSNMAPEQFRA
jgi:hypothetical protein